MKKIRLVCLLMGVLLLFCACDHGSGNGEENPGSSVHENPTLAEFQIVRPDVATADVQNAVLQLNRTIRAKTGSTLSLKTDFEASDEVAYEILIGKTTRPATTATLQTLKNGDYVIQTVATDTAVKIVVLGYTDEQTIYAVEQLCEMIEKGEIAGEDGKVKTLNFSKNYYGTYQNYRLDISDPITVYQSPANTKQGWGYYQFPNLYTTTTGELLAHWAYSEDSVLGGGEDAAAVKWAVSSDGGQTWTPVTESQIAKYPIDYSNNVKTANGKHFVSFSGAASVSVPASRVTARPYAGGTTNMWYGGKQVRVYLASDIAKLGLLDVNTFVMNEYDPVTKKPTSRKVTVNWPHMPVGAYVDGSKLVLTAPSHMWEISGSQNMIEKDGVLYYTVYGTGFDSSKSSISSAIAGGLCYYSSVYVFSSVDGGSTWNYLSQISPKDIPNFKAELNVEGPCEPSISVMQDGSIVMLFRTGDASTAANARPSYMVRSTDNGKTWSTPVQFDKLGVLPQILALDCGVTLSSYGRPGVFVKSTSDLTGQTWKDRVEIALSPKSPYSNETRLSCGYTDLLPLSATSALLIYTDFHHPVGNGTYTKAIMVRTITVVPN